MRFPANMSHEIRTPLNGIIGLAQVLNDLALSGDQRAVLDDIGRSGHHLLAIVNDVLDMAKVSSGKLSTEQVPFDLPALIRDVSSPAAVLAEGAGLRLFLDLPPDLPQFVQGDALRVRQVVSNLLSNAVKFTPAGEVRLTVQSPRPGWIRFMVSDTGIGLSREQQEGLFQEFHQVDSSPSRRFAGSGLGLAISHRLGGLMGGRLWVESRLGAANAFAEDRDRCIRAGMNGYVSKPLKREALMAAISLLTGTCNRGYRLRQSRFWAPDDIPTPPS